jgi:hypothetical protein
MRKEKKGWGGGQSNKNNHQTNTLICFFKKIIYTHTQCGFKAASKMLKKITIKDIAYHDDMSFYGPASLL